MNELARVPVKSYTLNKADYPVGREYAVRHKNGLAVLRIDRFEQAHCHTIYRQSRYNCPEACTEMEDGMACIGGANTLSPGWPGKLGHKTHEEIYEWLERFAIENLSDDALIKKRQSILAEIEEEIQALEAEKQKILAEPIPALEEAA